MNYTVYIQRLTHLDFIQQKVALFTLLLLLCLQTPALNSAYAELTSNKQLFEIKQKLGSHISFNSAPNFSSITFHCQDLTPLSVRGHVHMTFEQPIKSSPSTGLVLSYEYSSVSGELRDFFSVYHQDGPITYICKFYKEKFHQTTNEHWITHIYFQKGHMNVTSY